jgi:predicted HD superfamily hydrolase involved in NAD metabolism
MLKKSEIVEKLKRALDPERFRHSEEVEKVAVVLAEKWGADPEKASTAALLHDASRSLSPPEMLEKASALGLSPTGTEKEQPKLLHSRLSRHFAITEFEVTDEEILQAIERHTLGAPGMSTLDKVIYLADHIEPGRDYEGVEEVRRLAYTDINKAIARSTTLMIESLEEKGSPIHPDGIKTRDHYLRRK